MFLTHNAETLMENERQNAFNKMACSTCSSEETMLPEQHLQSCNKRTCHFDLYNYQGVGLGRDYFNAPESKQPAFKDVDTSSCKRANTNAFVPRGEWKRSSQPSGGY
jgi:hypothetical protein